MKARPLTSRSQYWSDPWLLWPTPGAVQGEDDHETDGQRADQGADQEHAHPWPWPHRLGEHQDRRQAERIQA